MEMIAEEMTREEIIESVHTLPPAELTLLICIVNLKSKQEIPLDLPIEEYIDAVMKYLPEFKKLAEKGLDADTLILLGEARLKTYFSKKTR